MNKLNAVVGRISTWLRIHFFGVATACVAFLCLLFGVDAFAQNPGSISISSGGTLTETAQGYSQGIADFIEWGKQWVYYIVIAAILLGVLVVGVRKIMRR